MSIRSRMQAPFHLPQENPNLKPLPPQVDPNSARGRFQHIGATAEAEERTRVSQPQEVHIVQSEAPKPAKETKTTTTIIEEEQH